MVLALKKTEEEGLKFGIKKVWVSDKAVNIEMESIASMEELDARLAVLH